MPEISPLRRRMIEDMTVRNLSPALGTVELRIPKLRRKQLLPDLPGALGPLRSRGLRPWSR